MCLYEAAKKMITLKLYKRTYIPLVAMCKKGIRVCKEHIGEQRGITSAYANTHTDAQHFHVLLFGYDEITK